MNAPTDVLGRDLFVGARVGCAFSYSQASVGHIRLGTIHSLDATPSKYNPNRIDVTVRVLWEENNILSPKMKYGAPSRWVIL